MMKYYFLALGTLVVVCVGCISDGQQLKARNDYNAPPAALQARPGPMVDGPGPGVMGMMGGGQGHPGMMQGPPPGMMHPGMMGGGGHPGMMGGAPAGPPRPAKRTQVRFLQPVGMSIGWEIDKGYAENQILTPGRYNFLQGYTYRLKINNIQGREGMVLYPTMQVYPAHPLTDAYLAHNSVPLELTDEDLDQIESNNFVTKVIYLPDAKFQELAIAGVETLVSTRLEPGVNPVAEAERRGTIMAVLRVGNMDLEMPNRVPGAPAGGGVEPVSFQVDGEKGQIVDPAPIGGVGVSGLSIPNSVIAATSGMPGQPAYHPMPGMGPTQVWGMPMTGTPIGLPGPPHLPFGGRASLKTHTIRNLTRQDIPDPVEDMVIDVSHKPGIRLPKPVKYIRYQENHPNLRPDELSVPAWAQGGAGAQGGGGSYGPNGEYCPPGQAPTP